jgi:hypothetical protein
VQFVAKGINHQDAQPEDRHTDSQVSQPGHRGIDPGTPSDGSCQTTCSPSILLTIKATNMDGKGIHPASVWRLWSACLSMSPGLPEIPLPAIWYTGPPATGPVRTLALFFGFVQASCNPATGIPTGTASPDYPAAITSRKTPSV